MQILAAHCIELRLSLITQRWEAKPMTRKEENWQSTVSLIISTKNPIVQSQRQQKETFVNITS